MDLALSPHALFFGGRRRLFVYHALNGSVVRLGSGAREALKPLVPDLPCALEPGPGTDEPLDRARERLLRWRTIVPPDLDEVAELETWYPARSVWSVFYVREDHAVLRVRLERGSGMPVFEPLDGLAAALWLACDGTRTLATIRDAAGSDGAQVLELLREWTRWDRQQMKFLPRRLPDLAMGGLPVEFLTHVKDLPRAPLGREAPPHEAVRAVRFRSPTTSLAQLFQLPHPALGGRTYGGALATAALGRGLLGRAGGHVVEIGAGDGALAKGFLDVIERDAPAVAAGLSYTIVEHRADRESAQRASVARAPGHLKERVVWRRPLGSTLPIGSRSTTLLLADAPDGPLSGRGSDARTLVDEVARVLAPDGAALIPDLGVREATIRPADSTEREERLIRIELLLERALDHQLKGTVEPLSELLGFDLAMPLLFADEIHMRELVALARAVGRELPVLAYTPEMLSAALAGALDVERLANLSFASLGALEPFGRSPRTLKVITLRAPPLDSAPEHPASDSLGESQAA